MPSSKLNEAEMYLIRNWPQAYLVQRSMEGIREKYAALYEQVWEQLKSAHAELDFCEIRVTQFWCKGYMGVGRKKWGGGDWKGGIYIERLRLELLLDDKENPPYIGVYAGKAKRPATDVDGVKRVLLAAKELLTKEERSRCTEGEPSEFDFTLWYWLPESRKELVEMLLDGDGQRFADCLVSHFDVFLKLWPVLDEVFTKPSKGV